jgi:ComEC/Rec2-related protein
MWGRLRRNLPYEEASVAMGIVAGQQSLVSREMQADMQRAGTLHLLATSGYNVLLLAGLLMVLLSHLPLHRGIQLAVAIVALLAYADAVGGRPPVIRATLMAGLYLGTFLFARSPDTLSVWAAAAVGCLLLEPATLFDAGFHLSFATVLALILYLPGAIRIIEKWTERYRSSMFALVTKWGFASLATTVIAGIASAPLTAYNFGQISVVSPLSNLLTAPAIPLVYVGAGSAQVADAFSQPVARGLDVGLTGAFSGWIAGVNSLLGGLSWSAVPVVMPGWLAAVCLSLIPLFSRPRRRDPAEAAAGDQSAGL